MTLFFSFPGYEPLTKTLSKKLNYPQGDVTIRHFPDGESFVKINTDVKNKDVLLVCGLDHPDAKVMALLFFASLAKELGAQSVTLIAPYLGYMRQDIRFHEGEAISSTIFATFLSQHIDRLITIDPHLHRHKTLDEIYTVPAVALHATQTIATWVKKTISLPVLIGPDEESEQWVSEVARQADVPFIILTKKRYGDRDVEVSVPDVHLYQGHTPVLIDDIISTARTMIETVNHLRVAEMNSPICIGVHAIFAEGAYVALLNSGVEKVITCNTIPHISNAIDVGPLISEALLREK